MKEKLYGRAVGQRSTTFLGDGGIGMEVQHPDGVCCDLYIKQWGAGAVRAVCQIHRLAILLAQSQ